MLLVIIASIIVLTLLITMFTHLKRKLKSVKAIALIIVLLIISSSIYIWVKKDTNDLSSPQGVINSIYMYVGWLGSNGAVILDYTKESFTIIGNVIKGEQTKKSSSEGRK
jgi:predicted tellurium resistance membrane protein TerC